MKDMIYFLRFILHFLVFFPRSFLLKNDYANGIRNLLSWRGILSLVFAKLYFNNRHVIIKRKRMHIKSERASSISLNKRIETSKKHIFALNSFFLQNFISSLQCRALHFHAFMHKHDQCYF